MNTSIKRWALEIIEQQGKGSAGHLFHNLSEEALDEWLKGDESFDEHIIRACFDNKTPWLFNLETVTWRSLKEIFTLKEPGIYNLVTTPDSGISTNLYHYEEMYQTIFYTAKIEDYKSREAIVIDTLLDTTPLNMQKVEHLSRKKPVFIVSKEPIAI